MNKQVRGILFLFLIFLACLTLIRYQALAATKPVAKGSVLPTIYLGLPEDAAAREYLGLAASGKFTIPQIKAQVVIIQVLSRY
jgi:hypothetical protein